MGIWKGSITVPNDDDDNNNNWLNNMERGINALRGKENQRIYYWQELLNLKEVNKNK